MSRDITVVPEVGFEPTITGSEPVGLPITVTRANEWGLEESNLFLTGYNRACATTPRPRTGLGKAQIQAVCHVRERINHGGWGDRTPTALSDHHRFRGG